MSCIIPTRNRRRFVGQAVRYFLRQDYEPKELVVVDDGEDEVRDLLPDDPRVTYRRLAGPVPLGSKRNLACGLSRGEVIAHWDDDDWMSPDRLSRQVDVLVSSGAVACGTRSLLYYSPKTARAWWYVHPSAHPPWLAGGTLVYRRSAWERHRFPDVPTGEDAAFVRRLDPRRLAVLEDASFYVALLHGSNGAPKNLADPRWRPAAVTEVARVMASDRPFYAALRNGGHGPERPRSVSDRITVAAPFMVYDGYGSMAEYLVRGMVRAGATVDPVPLTLDRAGLSEEFRAILARSRPVGSSPVLFSNWLTADLARFEKAADLFVHTMWETSELPRGWAERLNRARAVIVPTRFVAGVCRRSGVTVPVEVVPEGIDPSVYRHVERTEREGLTTLIVATVVGRKHVAEGVAAWQRAFEGDPAARLVVKSRFGIRGDLPRDHRISVDARDAKGRGIADLYAGADVLLALGNEGFGLPLVEGMATGLPVVALASEGQRDVCLEAGDRVLSVEPVSWETYDEPPFGRCGVRGVPGVEDVADGLRWVARHRDEARAMGRAASDWAIAHRDVWRKGPAVLGVMEGAARPPRPLRRTRAMVVPSLGRPCGVAEYASDLAAALPGLRLAGDWPDPRGLRLLHVQHEGGILGDAELNRRAAAAREAGARVVVTEHTVRDLAHPWEAEAAALVALTEEGGSALRRRWPRTRVEVIPHGCHTWFPPRKRRPGRVVGAFGFMEPHKGFARLLDVLREVAGTELVLFSHAKSPGADAWWEAARAGLPVRRVGGYLPAPEVARRLAGEADVLVFWYDEVPHAAASGAVRVGLATGVPVLASPTSWFADLREVTYQPDDPVEGVRRLLEDPPLRDRLSEAAREYCHQHAWGRVARRHLALWSAVEQT